MTEPTQSESRLCPCGQPLPARPDAEVCSARCRKRKARGDFYVVTEEDRAAMRRVAEAVPIPEGPWLAPK